MTTWTHLGSLLYTNPNFVTNLHANKHWLALQLINALKAYLIYLGDNNFQRHLKGIFLTFIALKIHINLIQASFTISYELSMALNLFSCKHVLCSATQLTCPLLLLVTLLVIWPIVAIFMFIIFQWPPRMLLTFWCLRFVCFTFLMTTLVRFSILILFRRLVAVLN